MITLTGIKKYSNLELASLYQKLSMVCDLNCTNCLTKNLCREVQPLLDYINKELTRRKNEIVR